MFTTALRVAIPFSLKPQSSFPWKELSASGRLRKASRSDKKSPFIGCRINLLVTITFEVIGYDGES